MLRFARDPDGMVRPDPERQREGRGAYLCGEAECTDKASDGRGFARAFRARVTVDEKTLDFGDEWQRSEYTR